MRVETFPSSLSPFLPSPLVVLLGPTAVGKTALSLELAERFDGEIVSADSRQIYRGMDIGTAKPSAAERARVPHHLLDVAAPDAVLSLADYQRLAYAAIADIQRRGRLPFLVGGSALYVRAVAEGLRIPEVPPNPVLRAELEAVAEAEGYAALHRRLAELDPAGAAQIDARNVRRVVRALEIVLETGQPKSALEGAEAPPYRILRIGLDLERELLHARIVERVRQMVDGGLADETARLLAAGYAANLPALTSLGYREMGQHLRGELTLEQASERISIETNRFVRHQSTWFRRMDDIFWFDWARPDVEAVARLVVTFLGQG
ncbi:MAG: tRNA (adenosine(37)-N6)-dimethylallyltransferase MiaA [Chloroflexi bacterium]|nr:MAG: tRNA (adenosine(37)-N6)-dimethylallyltransferase MiaA [Chloroflexota bacterium]